ncbi:hypothetical protein BV210_08335 [Halorientalis sp. IM1011]|uniref:hypothetical protein n=1 Tax=Halorientalis sp. IM1011 TaxID=1932360 RepID=UPI00097CD2C6|nr:hypothetical protein [Halorientalis sp. IM1011]AQL42718.1 hypothetical protein BV210_08335 [Halorientalis sp. IM1011]
MSARSPTLCTRLDALRTDLRSRRLATAGAVVVGLVTVPFHWLGFVLGGALVALVQPSIRRGLLAGLGFGVLSWLVFALWLAGRGDLVLYLGMGQVLTVSTAVPLVGSLLGALARGIR